MICQVCKSNNATIHYKTNLNGNKTELYLCEECAKKHGIAKKTNFEPINVIDGFFGKSTDDIFGGLFAGMMNDASKKSVNEPAVCKVCGMRFSDFLHGGKVGCSECYNVFSSSLSSTVKRIHGHASHCGKIPEGKKNEMSEKKKLESLREKLNRAIENQEYEMAAKYRDEIREIENKNGEVK